jgi:predicted dithiol-disulfide oxidoreductase (DUF899 family)
MTKAGRTGIEKHAVVSHERWLSARKALLAKEKEFTRRRDDLSRKRRELPWEKVEKDYLFDGPSGQETLPRLFGQKSQLVVYHLMFNPAADAGCKHCSFWADNFNGIDVHLRQRDVSFLAISRAPLPRIEAFKKRMGWTFGWVSSFGCDFNYDYHVSVVPQQSATGEVIYNYAPRKTTMEELPGSVSSTRMTTGASFTHIRDTRGLDMLNGAYHWLDLVPKGRNESGPTRWRGCACTTNTRGNGRSARGCRQPVGDDLAPLQHQGDARGVLQQAHVAERVAGDDEEIGELALFDGADIALHAETLGGPAGRRTQCLQRRQPGFDQALDLHRVLRMTVSAGVGSGGDLDAGGEGPPQALGVMLLQVLCPLANMRQGRFAVIFVDREGRHEEDAALGHLVERFRLLVEITAVLDRIDAGLDRDAQPTTAQRVAHHAAIERVRLVGQRLHFVEIEGAVARPMTGT